MNRSRTLNSLLDDTLRLLSVNGTDAELNQLKALFCNRAVAFSGKQLEDVTPDAASKNT